MTSMKITRKTIKKIPSLLWRGMKFHTPRLWRRATLIVPGNEGSEGILVAGPFIGELGYEIGEWVPHLKGLMDRFHCRAHVFTRNGHEVLYPFAETIHTFDFPNKHVRGHWLFEPYKEEIGLYHQLENNVRKYAAEFKLQGRYQMLEVCDTSRLYKAFPDKVPVRLTPSDELKTKWENILPSTPKVVFTYRANVRGNERNSNSDLTHKMADYVIQNGWTPVLVGKIDDDFPIPDIPGVNLINRTTLADLIAIYTLSSLVIGSSTGIIHLAAGCNIPHITWGSTTVDDTVVTRYNKNWNLNNTWVRFISKSWDVHFEDIKDVLTKADFFLQQNNNIRH